MAEKVLMIALSPTMEEGTIVSWSKQEGDKVDTGDTLCEVETDKAAMDYESTQEGTLLKIVRGEGSSAKVGETIAILGEEGEDIAALEEEIAQEASAGETAGGEAADGDSAAGEAAAAAEGASGAGSAAGAAKKGDRQRAEVPGSEAAADAGARDGAEAAQPGPATQTGAVAGGRVKASPLARKLAESRGIDISQVPGSGPDGRVVKADVEGFTPAAAPTGVAEAPGAGSGAAVAAQTGMVAAPPAEDRVVPVDRARQTIAGRLQESKNTAPHFYLKVGADVSSLMGARTRINKELGDKLSLNAFLIKVSAEALKRHPNVNASWQGDHILQYGSVDVGLAVEQPTGGLITPVVRNCGNRGVVDIDAELKELIGLARSGKLTPEQYTGATFTISNLGNFGIEEFTAIINPPASTILAVGGVKQEPVFDDGGNLTGAAPMMRLTLSCDHRVVDGAAGARFLNLLKQIVEEPMRALL